MFPSIFLSPLQPLERVRVRLVINSCSLSTVRGEACIISLRNYDILLSIPFSTPDIISL
jgi:hypothetical protein